MDRREGSGFGSSSTEWLGTSICIERIETKQRSCNKAAVAQDVHALQFASYELKEDYDVANVSLPQNGEAIRCATSNNHTTR